MKFTVIKNKEQYDKYCDILEELILSQDTVYEPDIELLTILIEKWDYDNSKFNELDTIKLLKYLMFENNLTKKDMSKILNLSEYNISEILKYNKRFSAENIEKLSKYFKISKEIFSRPYRLNSERGESQLNELHSQIA